MRPPSSLAASQDARCPFYPSLESAADTADRQFVAPASVSGSLLQRKAAPLAALRGHAPGSSLSASSPSVELPMRTLILAALLALACAGTAAQDKIYKVRMPDGRILFTDRPPPGGVIVSEREAPPPTPAAPPPARAGAPAGSLQEQAAQAETRLRERAAAVDEAFAKVQAAERELEAAKARLEQGRAPGEGEMLGTARGRVRPGPAYQQRVADLEKAVVEAEQKLAQAREQLNAVR